MTHPCCEDLSNGIEKLLQACDHSSDLPMSQLSLVYGNNHGQKPNANTSNESSDVEHLYSHACCLDYASYYEYATSHENRPTPAQAVCVRGEEGTAEASCCEERDDGS